MAFEVRRVNGRCAATTVPSSGTVTWKSPSTSSSSPSTSTSALSVSSTSRTVGSVRRIAVSSGRGSRNSSEKTSSRRGVPRLALARGDAQQLLGVVPLVERAGLVDALVALQAHQAAARRLGHRARQLRLAHARGALDEQRLAQAVGEEDGGRDGRGGDVADVGEPGGDVVDGVEQRLLVDRLGAHAPASCPVIGRLSRRGDAMAIGRRGRDPRSPGVGILGVRTVPFPARRPVPVREGSTGDRRSVSDDAPGSRNRAAPPRRTGPHGRHDDDPPVPVAGRARPHRGRPPRRLERVAGRRLRPGGDRDRAGLGQLPLGLDLRRVLGHPARDHGRRRGHRPRPAALGQRRPDGAVLLRHRARGQARVRDGRAARPVEGGGPARGGRRGPRPAGAAVPAAQPVGAGRVRVGRRDLHRHRVPARRARRGRARARRARCASSC